MPSFKSYGRKFSKSFKKSRAPARTSKKTPFTGSGDPPPPSLWIAPKPRRSFAIRPHYFHRKYFTTSFISTTSPGGINTGIGFNLVFQLSQVSGYTEFTALFDQFAITKVKVTFIPKFTNNSTNSMTVGSANGGAFLSSMFVAIDYDSSVTTPTGSAPLLERETTIRKRHDKEFSLTFQPKPNMMTYLGVATTSYSIPRDGYNWVDNENPTTPHYGMIGWIDPPLTTGMTVSYDLEIDYYFAFKGVI